MKTTNYVKAFGTINLSLIIVGLILWYFFHQPTSLNDPPEANNLMAIGIGVFYSSCALLGLINGVLSFLVNFDFKKG